MTAKSYELGHEIVYVDGKWSTAPKTCKRCGREPTPEGYDACTGHVPGATSVCCGHGVTTPILIKERL